MLQKDEKRFVCVNSVCKIVDKPAKRDLRSVCGDSAYLRSVLNMFDFIVQIVLYNELDFLEFKMFNYSIQIGISLCLK